MNKFFVTVTLSILSVVALVAPALASSSAGHHEPQGPDSIAFIATIVNFLILALGLFFALKKPAKEFFAGRSVKFKLHLDESKTLHDEAYRSLEEIECKLKNVDVEGKKLLTSVKEQAEKEKQNIVLHARESAEKLAADTIRKIDQELVKAKAELKAEAVHLASGMAANDIREQITADDHVRLGASFITEIKKAGLS